MNNRNLTKNPNSDGQNCHDPLPRISTVFNTNTTIRMSKVIFDPGGFLSSSKASSRVILTPVSDDAQKRKQTLATIQSNPRYANNDMLRVQQAAADYIGLRIGNDDLNQPPKAVYDLCKRLCDISDPIYQEYMWVDVNNLRKNMKNSGKLLWIYLHNSDILDEKRGLDGNRAIVNFRRKPGFYSNPKCTNMVLDIMVRDVKSHPPDLNRRKPGCYKAERKEPFRVRLVWIERRGGLEVTLRFGDTINCKRPKRMCSNVLCVGVLSDNQELPVNITLNHFGI